MQAWWDSVTTIQLAGTDVWRVLTLFAALLGGLLFGRMLQYILVKSSPLVEQRGRRLTAVAMRALSRAAILTGFAVGLRMGMAFLDLREEVAGLLITLHSILVTLTVGFAAYNLVEVVDAWLLGPGQRAKDQLNDMLLPMVRTSLRITIVVLSVLQIAQLLTDKPLTSILAGLGVGGLAVALAAQDTVKNFFGSLVIFADKPFQIGERVVVDTFDGVVEEVGFRSTRLRTLDGHLVTIPNGELANKSIQNIGRRPYLRRILNLGLPYDTPPAQVGRALEILRELLRDHEGQHPNFPPRVLFQEFAASSLNLQVTYWYHPGEQWLFMQFNERINLSILERFRAEGLTFAFPTQTIYLAGSTQVGGPV